MGMQGVVNGCDVLLYNLVIYDLVIVYNLVLRLIFFFNMVVVGGVGGGKLSFVKMVCVIWFFVICYCCVVIFDKKNCGGEGEYVELVCEWGQGELIWFIQDGLGFCLNLFDLFIVSQIGDVGIYCLLYVIICIVCDGVQFDVWDEKVVCVVLFKMFVMFDVGCIVILGDIFLWFGCVDVGDDDMLLVFCDWLYQVGFGICFIFEGLLDEYGGLFDGEMSKGVDLIGKFILFDILQLFVEGLLLNVICVIGNQWMLG